MAIERELKYRLTKSDYQKLLRAVRPFKAKKVRQHNYYFDDSHFTLRKNKLGLRIRILGNHRALLTLKRTLKQTRTTGLKAYKVRKEFETNLPFSAAKSIVQRRSAIQDVKAQPIRVLRRMISPKVRNNLRPIGKLSTDRKIVWVQKTLAFEIDRFQIFDKIFYEFEVETTRPTFADKAVREFLHDNHITYRPERTSKLKRFLKELRKRN